MVEKTPMKCMEFCWLTRSEVFGFWKLFRETPGSISITSSFLDIVILAPIITIIVTVSPMQV